MAKNVELSIEDIEAQIKELMEKKNEISKGQKLKDVIALLEQSPFTEISNVELYLLGKAKIVLPSSNSKIDEGKGKDSKEEKGTRTRFDLKSEHNEESVLNVLDTETKKSKDEILKELGIVEKMALNGASSFDSYKTKFVNNVFVKLIEDGKIIKHGNKIAMTYTKA